VSVGRVEDERSFDIDTIQTSWSWAATERLLLRLGGEFKHMEGNYDYMDEVEFELVFLTPGASLEPEREQEFHVQPDGDQLAAWIGGRVELTNHLSADLGLRWDKQTLSDDDGIHTSPRVSAMYAFNDRSSLRASWGRFFQYQSIDELQIIDGVTRFQGSQRADHLVLGFQHAFRNGIDLRVEAYRKDIDRIQPRYENFLYSLALLPELQPDRIEVDADKATAEGIEVSASRMDRSPLGWWLHYSWSDVEDKFPYGAIPRIWDQDHALGVGLNYQRGPWNMSVAGTYHAGWRTSRAELVATEPVAVGLVAKRNGERLEDYYVVDLRVSRDVPVRNGQLTAFLEISNVLSRRNQCCKQYEFTDGLSDEGEIEDVELALETDKWLPLFPSLGFVWRF
jgi:outer membrane cobalamin receptor